MQNPALIQEIIDKTKKVGDSLTQINSNNSSLPTFTEIYDLDEIIKNLQVKIKKTLAICIDPDLYEKKLAVDKLGHQIFQLKINLLKQNPEINSFEDGVKQELKNKIEPDQDLDIEKILERCEMLSNYSQQFYKPQNTTLNNVETKSPANRK